MARTNPQVEALEQTNRVLREQLVERRRDPGDMPVRGCGDNSCLVERSGGGGVRFEVSREDFHRDPAAVMRQAGDNPIFVLDTNGQPSMVICVPNPDDEDR